MRTKIVEYSPNVFDIGRNLKESLKLQKEHDGVIAEVKVSAKCYQLTQTQPISAKSVQQSMKLLVTETSHILIYYLAGILLGKRLSSVW